MERGLINKYFDQTHKEQELHSTTLSTPPLPNEKEYTIENYDIETLDDLILWKPGFTIRPALEAFILRVKEFIEKDISELTASLLKEVKQDDTKNMMRYLIKRNKFFLILKTNWDYIEEKIEDFKVFIRIASILSIDASEVNINRLCKSLLNNTSLLENFILDDLRKI